MDEYQVMLDVLCDGLVNFVKSGILKDFEECVNYLKFFGYFNDVFMVGICCLLCEVYFFEICVNSGVVCFFEDLCIC